MVSMLLQILTSAFLLFAFGFFLFDGLKVEEKGKKMGNFVSAFFMFCAALFMWR